MHVAITTATLLHHECCLMGNCNGEVKGWWTIWVLHTVLHSFPSNFKRMCPWSQGVIPYPPWYAPLILVSRIGLVPPHIVCYYQMNFLSAHVLTHFNTEIRYLNPAEVKPRLTGNQALALETYLVPVTSTGVPGHGSCKDQDIILARKATLAGAQTPAHQIVIFPH